MATVTRHIDCAPEYVLSVLADGWTYATWVVGTSSIRHVDLDWPAPEARIAHRFGVWPATIDDETFVRAWHPGTGIDLQVRGWPAGEARVRVDVRPAGTGCEVRMIEDAVRGPGLLVPKPLRTAVLIPRNNETLRRLAMLARGRAERG